MSHEINTPNADPSQKLTVAYMPTGSLESYTGNARTHSKKQVRQIAESIKAFGFTNPILVDDQGSVIAGHGRLEAAKLLGLTTVPTIRIAYLSPPQKRLLRLAENKVAENAGWDSETLALELKQLIEIDIDIDLTITGFETAEIDLIFKSLDSGGYDPALDAAPEVDRGAPPISRPGDLWLLEKHRLLCGDATRAAAFAQLMGEERAQMIFIDPPYNVPIDGHARGLGRFKHQDFVMAAGEMSEAEFIEFLSAAIGNLVTFSNAGAIHFVCMDWRHVYELLTVARAVYDGFENLCVWNKSNGGMGSLYRSKHELVCVFKSGRARHVNNVELGRHGRNRTNVWDYPGINTFGGDRLDALAIHPTVKPVALVADAILDCSTRRSIVLDSFAGSGTTIIAAQQVDRRAYAMELDPLYVDAGIRRWHDVGGETAVHDDTGQSFTEMLEIRADEEGLSHV